MKITQLDDDGGRKILQVEAEWDEIATDYEDIVDDYIKVPVAGFRADRAPRRVVEKRFHRQIIDELSRRCASRLSREALRETGVEPMGPIEIRDIECGKGKPFQFTACFWPIPEIELPDFGSLHIREGGSDPRDLVSHRLLEMMSFTIPDELVRTELGADDSNNSNESAAWKAATDRVRLILILKRIAGREGIEVSEADIERRIKDKAAEFGTNLDALKTELEKGGGKQRLKDMLLAESTLDYLTEKIRVSSDEC